MQIVCYNCKNIWELTKAEIHSARREAGQASEKLNFICPRCGAKNVVTEEELIITDRTQSPVPMEGARLQEETEEKQSSITEDTGNAAPTNPVESPRSGKQRRGIVRVRGLEAHRDHNTWSEVMGKFYKDETVPVLDTWTDGESTWVQLGPERWVTIDQDGQAAIEFIDE